MLKIKKNARYWCTDLFLTIKNHLTFPLLQLYSNAFSSCTLFMGVNVSINFSLYIILLKSLLWFRKNLLEQALSFEHLSWKEARCGHSTWLPISFDMGRKIYRSPFSIQNVQNERGAKTTFLFHIFTLFDPSKVYILQYGSRYTHVCWA